MSLSETVQEWIVIAAAIAAAGFLLRRRARAFAAGPISAWLLHIGRVGLAMRIRKAAMTRDRSRCSGCH